MAKPLIQMALDKNERRGGKLGKDLKQDQKSERTARRADTKKRA